MARYVGWQFWFWVVCAALDVLFIVASEKEVERIGWLVNVAGCLLLGASKYIRG